LRRGPNASTHGLLDPFPESLVLRLLWTALIRALVFLPLIGIRALRRLLMGRRFVARVSLGKSRSDQGASLAASRTLVEGLQAMAGDDRVRGVVVDLRNVRGGWASVQELRRAIAGLRKSGKLVVAHLDGLDLRDLYLASATDRVWLTPSGIMAIQGLGARLQFLGDALTGVGVTVEMEAAGEYKSFGERFTRAYPSSQNREALSVVLEDLQEQVVAGIAAGREVDPDVVIQAMNEGPVPAERALELGLVDGVAYPDQARTMLRELLGGRARQGDFGRYQRWSRVEQWLERLGRGGPSVAIVHLEGPIVHGAEAQGGVGNRIDADRVVPVLDELRRSSNVRSVVLYVNSPGGSALASDLIARAVRRLADNKPVVASFDDVSASGGYYLSAPASEIVAREGTITGSIGVVGGKVVVGPALAQFGVHGETVTAGPGAGFFSPWRRFTRVEREQYRAMLTQTYDRFIAIVAGGRKRPKSAITPYAEGRIWTGRQALEHGLVDHLGGLDRAMARSRALAGLEPGEGHVRHIRFAPPRFRMISSLLGRGSTHADPMDLILDRLGAAGNLARMLRAEPGAPLALLPWDIDGVE
jgi:protease IV